MGIPQDKLQMADEISGLESQLVQAENSLRDKDLKLQSAKTSRISGAAAILIGLILMFIFEGFLGYLGIFLILIGVLAWVTALFQESSAKKELTVAVTRNAQLRGKLAELRAQASLGATLPPLEPSVEKTRRPVEDRFAKLTKLKDNGPIDQEEYAQKRQQALREV
jgi:hypothetical protein